MSKQPAIGRMLGALYWMIVLSFSTLEPWGNIDTRNFSYMGSWKFSEYNAFIVLQMIAMLILGAVLWRNRADKRTILWITAINTLFVSMNAFDLVHFFPDPAQPMPRLVAFIEAVDSLAALGIIFCAQRVVPWQKSRKRTGQHSPISA